MCKIGININATTPNGTSLTSTALGRYRLAGGGATDWVNFTISLVNPETPNITVIGSYELQVNVTNNIADTSAWSNTVTFNVSSSCGTTNPSPATTSCIPFTITRPTAGSVDLTWTANPSYSYNIYTRYGTNPYVKVGANITTSPFNTNIAVLAGVDRTFCFIITTVYLGVESPLDISTCTPNCITARAPGR